MDTLAVAIIPTFKIRKKRRKCVIFVSGKQKLTQKSVSQCWHVSWLQGFPVPTLGRWLEIMKWKSYLRSTTNEHIYDSFLTDFMKIFPYFIGMLAGSKIHHFSK
jgi:hypothetical protein